MRTEVAIISALALVLSVPLAFGEIVETKGQNYDLVENFFIGEANWVSHPERIMDGGWQNYALSNTGDKIIFNTNAVGSFIFDKNSCSYSIYGNGFSGEQIIPSVSAVATYLNNGQWQNLPVNDELCTVTVEPYEDGVYLTSTKVITEDITEDIFIPYTGTTQNFYSNSTNSQFTLVTNSTGNVGYFNGETITTTGIVIDKFVQEIRLDINSGFKETFKVIHDGDQPLGISQTIHSGDSITIGETVIDIAELNGQSFDRQFIIDNEAEILAITDSVNYDFDTGIESLSNVNIIFDGDYKVNMDYASGDFVGYLEIDPTFTSTPSGTQDGWIRDDNNNNQCDTSSFRSDSTGVIEPHVYGSPSAHVDCQLGFIEFPITGIPSNIVVTDLELSFYVTGVYGTPDQCDVRPITTNQPTTSTDQSVFTEIMGGTDYTQLTECQTTGQKSNMDLGSQAKTDFTNSAVSNGWFALGLKQDTDTVNADKITSIASSEHTTYDPPMLSVTYSLPIAPQPPTGLSTVTGIPIELDWTAPTDNGGSSITGYKVFRTQNEFAQTELPDNSANANGVDFTANEFLLHGFEDTITADQSLEFDGSNDYVQLPSLSTGYEFSASMWVKLDTVGDNTLLSDNGAWTTSGIVLEDRSATHNGLRVGHTMSGSDFDTSSNIPADGNYHHVVFNVGTPNEIWLDGVSIGTGGTAQSTSTSATFRMGSDNGNKFLDGALDDVAVWDRFLTDSEVASLYAGALPSTISSGLVAYYDMETVTASTISDVTSNNNDGTNNGSTALDSSVTVTSLPDKSTNSISMTSLGSAIQVHRASNDWLSLGFKLADETLHSSTMRFLDVSPYAENGSTPAITIIADGTTYTLPATSERHMGGSQNTGCSNPSSGTIGDSSAEWFIASAYSSNPTYNKCLRGHADFDISSIPASATITDATLEIRLDGNSMFTTDFVDVYLMSFEAGASSSFSDLYFGVPAGIQIASDSVYFSGTGSQTFSVYAKTEPVTPASTTGVIDTGIQSPDLSFTDSNLPDGTDDFSVGSWVKLDMGSQTSGFNVQEDGTMVTADQGFSSCADYTAIGSSPLIAQPRLQTPTTTGNQACHGAYWNFDLSSISGATITSATIEYDVSTINGSPSNCEWVGLTTTPPDGFTTYNDIMSGTVFATDDSSCTTTGTGKTVTLNSAGLSALTSSAGGDFNIGTTFVDSGQVRDSLEDQVRFTENTATLSLTYSAPPTNTKLLGINDVNFSVGTDSASVVSSTPVIQSSGSTGGWQYLMDTGQTSNGGWNVSFQGQEFNTGHTLIGKTISSISFDLSKNGSPADNVELVKLDSSDNITVLQQVDVSSISSSGSGSGNSANFATMTFNSFTPFVLSTGDKLGIHLTGTIGGYSSDAGCSGACTYIELAHTDGSDVIANANKYQISGAFDNGDISGDIKYTILYDSPIISATGLADNTSEAKNYVFTRDGNNWAIYQNGVSQATATDSTSLGTYTAGTSLAWNANGVKGSQNIGSLDGHVYPSGAVGWNDARAKTVGSITAGQEMSFTIDTSAQGFGAGAGYWGIDQSDTISSGSSNDIDYGFYIDGASGMDVLKDGSTLVSTSFAKGDVISISIDSSGNVVYERNGSQVGTSTGATSSNYYGHFLSISSTGVGFGGTVSYPTIPATVWTTQIDGMIDEYFIDSTALTSTEIDQVYENGKPLTPIATTNAVTTEYDDSTVVGGNDYYFSVKATNAIGDSDFLTPFVSGLAGTPADPPSSVSSTINSPNTAPLDITVSWSSPTNVGSGTLTGFEIYRDSVLINTVGLVTSYTDTVPSGGGTFEYKLKSLSTHGTSGFSGTTSTTTPTIPPTPTATPTLAIDNPNPSPLDIDVSWSAQTSGGSTITGYEVFRSADDITFTSVGTVTDLDFTDTVPSAGTWYYTFASTNLVGSSGQSPSNSITTATVPSSPLNASSVIPSINSAPYDVTVSWDLPTSTGGSALTGYNVYRQTGSGAFTLVTTTTALGYVDTVPSALNQDYTFKIHSLNNVGESTAFVTTTITTGDVPSAPVLSFTTGTTALSWTVPASDASITGYKIFRDSVLLTTVTTTTHSDFTTIVFGNSYDYKIVAVSSLGDSADSNTITTTPETEISGMIAQGITGTGAVIDWDEPAYYQGQVTNYEVYYSEITASVSTPTTSAGTTTNTYSNFAPTLDYDTTYIFGVKVISPLGNSGFSNYVTVTTNIDGSITSADPDTGGVAWFDIDAVNEDSLNVIKFVRETQVIGGNNTDTLQVGYPSWWDEMTCDVDYKFAQKTEQYIEGEDMTAVVNPNDANQQVIGFAFQDIDNEVIEIECAPQQSTQDDGASGKYVMTQNDLATGLPSIPLVTQINNFSTGEYGTDGDFGALNIVGLFVILVSMVGFNRVSPIVGVLISASMIFVLAWFGIITIPYVIVGVIALVIFLAWGVNRKR